MVLVFHTIEYLRYHFLYFPSSYFVFSLVCGMYVNEGWNEWWNGRMIGFRPIIWVLYNITGLTTLRERTTSTFNKPMSYSAPYIYMALNIKNEIIKCLQLQYWIERGESSICKHIILFQVEINVYIYI